MTKGMIFELGFGGQSILQGSEGEEGTSRSENSAYPGVTRLYGACVGLGRGEVARSTGG